MLTTFTYARDNIAIWQQAVKRLDKEKCSGIAIKNVFSMDLPQNIVYYANMHHFPVFLFTDNTLFFEDVIITEWTASACFGKSRISWSKS